MVGFDVEARKHSRDLCRSSDLPGRQSKFEASSTDLIERPCKAQLVPDRFGRMGQHGMSQRRKPDRNASAAVYSVSSSFSCAAASFASFHGARSTMNLSTRRNNAPDLFQRAREFEPVISIERSFRRTSDSRVQSQHRRRLAGITPPRYCWIMFSVRLARLPKPFARSEL